MRGASQTALAERRQHGRRIGGEDAGAGGGPARRRAVRRGAPTAAATRRLFRLAAAFNFAIALALVLLREALAPLLGLAPVAGTNLAFVYLTAGLVATLGYAYLRVAADPARNRAIVEVAVAGKLLAVVAVCWPWLAGEIDARLPLLVAVDLVFAVLFVEYLRRSRAR